MLIECCRSESLNEDSQLNVGLHQHPKLIDLRDYIDHFAPSKCISVRALAQHPLYGQFTLLRLPCYRDPTKPPLYEATIGLHPAGGSGSLGDHRKDQSMLEQLYKLRMQDLNLINEFSHSLDINSDNKVLRLK